VEFQGETGHGTGVTAGFYSRIASALSSRAAALNAPMALVEGPVLTPAATSGDATSGVGSGKVEEDGAGKGKGEARSEVASEVKDFHALRLNLNAIGMPIGWSPSQQQPQGQDQTEGQGAEGQLSLPFRVPSLASHALWVPGAGIGNAQSLQVASWRPISAMIGGEAGTKGSDKKNEGEGGEEEENGTVVAVDVRCTQPVWQMSASGEVQLAGGAPASGASASAAGIDDDDDDDDDDDVPDLEPAGGAALTADSEGPSADDATAAGATTTSSSSATTALEFPLVAVLRPSLFPGTFRVAGTRGNATTVLRFSPTAQASATAESKANRDQEVEAGTAPPYQSLVSAAGSASCSSAASSLLPSVGDTLELWPSSQGAQGRSEGSMKVTVLAVNGISGDASDAHDGVAELVVSGDLPPASAANKATFLGASYAPPLWVADEASASRASLGSLECPGGLFPAPLAPGVSGRDKAMLRRQFQFLGRLFGKVRMHTIKL